MSPMTPRERWLVLLAGERPDRIPTDIWYTPEVRRRLLTELDCPDDEALCRRLQIDRPHHVTQPFGAGATGKQPHHPDDPEADIWGLRYQPVSHGTGEYLECTHHPLAHATTVAEVEAFRWPRPEDFDYTDLPARFAALDGSRIVQAGSYEPFLLACQLRGMERAFLDLAAAPAIIEAILAQIFAFYYEHNRRILAAGAGRADLFYLAEDLGGQNGPLLSLAMYRRFLKPNQARMAELARRYGARVFYHTDGGAWPFLRELVDDVGIDLLNPIQYRCAGMQRERLVATFGDRVVFHGAIDNQYVLPFGSPADVAREVRENAAAFAGARWICAPCHMIQSSTPTANILALYETIDELSGRA
jgi:uroporphyrinogen decarboxylase